MNILIALAPVWAHEEAGLSAVLDEIQRDPSNNRFIRFAQSARTHFARFVMVRDVDHGLRLLFVANFDGGIQDYLQELSNVAPGIDEVIGRCQGAKSHDLMAFVRQYYCAPRGIYVAFPDLTVKQVLALIRMRDGLEALLDRNMGTAVAPDQPANGSSFLEELAQLPQGRSLLTQWAGQAGSSWAWIGRRIHGLALDGFLKVAEAFAKQGQSATFPLVHGGCADSQILRDIEQKLDTFDIGVDLIQNQMTTMTDVRPERLLRLNVALVGTALVARFGWPPGEFADVGSLHWFAWSVIDSGKRLLFISTFDGSWQNYMQDFIDKLVWGLDSLYGNVKGYPAAGMKDIANFTDFILGHQFAPQVFYSAYPRETVMNLIRDRQIADVLNRNTGRPEVASLVKLL
jgi:hypothetical protein